MGETYDSTADTLAHSRRVGELMGAPITELIQRSVCHDLSKIEDPEKPTFDEFGERLNRTTYGSLEYKANLTAMKPALDHHYMTNRHHPEFFRNGINGMTLVDLIEMLADWKAATERGDRGQMDRSLAVQRTRFGITLQLAEILRNTAVHFGWMPAE